MSPVPSVVTPNLATQEPRSSQPPSSGSPSPPHPQGLHQRLQVEGLLLTAAPVLLQLLPEEGVPMLDLAQFMQSVGEARLQLRHNALELGTEESTGSGDGPRAEHWSSMIGGGWSWGGVATLEISVTSTPSWGFITSTGRTQTGLVYKHAVSDICTHNTRNPHTHRVCSRYTVFVVNSCHTIAFLAEVQHREFWEFPT